MSENILKKINVGIIGGAGYTAGELIRILLNHPNIKDITITSTSQFGKKVFSIHEDLQHTNLVFSENINGEEDVIFLCLGHDHSSIYLKNKKLSNSTKIIDLSNEFRLKNNDTFNDRYFVYGLPELNKNEICNAQNIANPGSFATAIQLALLPLANKQLINDNIHISAITGSTGAGRSLSDSTHFSWRNNNISVYKTFIHQHLGEIIQTIHQLEPKFDKNIYFIPYRGDFTRGIFATVYLPFNGNKEEAVELFNEYYLNSLFVHISDSPVNIKQVVNTNNCFLNIEVIKGQIIITSVIDNLIKGASGQAIQNMNLMYGFDEKTGLNLKANYF